MNLGNGRLWDRLQRIHHVGADLKDMSGLVAVGPSHIGKVVAGRKDRPIGGDDDSISIANSDGLQSTRDLEHGFKRQRVALVGTIQSERGDRPISCDNDVLKLTHTNSLAVRTLLNHSARRVDRAMPEALVAGAQIGKPPDEEFEEAAGNPYTDLT